MTLREKQRLSARLYREKNAELIKARRLARYNPAKQREIRLRYESKNPERYRARLKARYKRNRAALLAKANEHLRGRVELMAAMKLERGCADCGYKAHPDALEFDHIGEKKAEVAALRTCSMERLMAEIGRCEVVCANCHRIRTARRRKEGRVVAA